MPTKSTTPPPPRVCPACGTTFEVEPKRAKQRCCSKHCAQVLRVRERGPMQVPTPASVRFWRLVDRRDESPETCWEWQGAYTRDGYGKFGLHRHAGISAHRFAYTTAHGAIPEGLCVLHRCDNKRCVRPDHLFLGTKADNTHDMMAKGRKNQARGEGAGKAKLTEDAVRAIRRRAEADPQISRLALAAEYGVDARTISEVIYRQTWRHLP